MADLKLDIAFWNYDRTRALADRTTKIPGIAAAYHTAPIVTEIFEGVIAGQYQVSELGFSYLPSNLSRDRRITLRRNPRVSKPQLPALGNLCKKGQRDSYT